jgi:hypothetical protein
MCLDMHNPWRENPENYHWKRACCIRRSCCFVLKSTEKCSNCIIFLFFQYFTPFFAFLSESWKIRCIFLQEKHVISIRKKVRKLLFLLNGKTWFVSNVFVPFFCVEHGFLKIDLPNMGIYHQKNAWNVLFSCFFQNFGTCFQFSEICRCMKHVFYSHNTSFQ